MGPDQASEPGATPARQSIASRPRPGEGDEMGRKAKETATAVLEPDKALALRAQAEAHDKEVEAAVLAELPREEPEVVRVLKERGYHQVDIKRAIMALIRAGRIATNTAAKPHLLQAMLPEGQAAQPTYLPR